MARPDFSRAKQYVLGRLEHECSPALVFHGKSNGQQYVAGELLPCAERIIAATPCSEEDALIARTATLYLPTGFIVQYRENLPIAADIAKHTLRHFGYSDKQRQRVADAIHNAATPNGSLPEQVVADAYNDFLGRDDYADRAVLLRTEQEYYGEKQSELLWLNRQFTLLHKHRYSTRDALLLRSNGKLQNLQKIMNTIKQRQR